MTLSGFTLKRLFLILTIAVIVFGTWTRLNIAFRDRGGGDYRTHVKAVSDLLSGKDPYVWTLETFKNLEKDPGNKGYAYLPGIMYLNAAFYIFYWLPTLYLPVVISDFFLKFSAAFMFQLPGIAASVLIGLFFIKELYKKNVVAMPFATAYWFFNPYFLHRVSLEGYDAVTICLLLWSFYFLEKDDVASGALYALSIIFKTFPVIAGLIFLFKAKDRRIFLIAAFIMGVFVSLPFFRSWQDFLIYIQGAVLVHNERFVQGRPYLYYISWFYRIEFFRIVPFKFYSISSIVSGWIISGIFLLSKKIKNKYVLSIFPFLSFYLFTPVLNKTYLTWGIPFFLIGSYYLFEKKYKALFYLFNIVYWIFAYWYLIQWKEGFHIWHPIY